MHFSYTINSTSLPLMPWKNRCTNETSVIQFERLKILVGLPQGSILGPFLIILEN